MVFSTIKRRRLGRLAVGALAVLLAGWAPQAKLAPEAWAAAKLAPLPKPKKQKAARVKLGRYLFFDGRLSGDGGISCATCHNPAKGWSDAKALSEGYPGTLYFRNAKTIMNVAFRNRVYWDGRLSGKDLPTMVRDHLTEAHFMLVDGRLFPERLKQIPEYEKMFKEAFGGEPGFGSTLKAVAAFIRSVTSKNVPFDNYLRGDKSALSPEAQRGLKLFSGKAACVQCHNGAMLSDGKFHALGVPENKKVFTEPQRHITYRRFLKTLGVAGYMTLREDVGHYAVTKSPGDRGKFLTPTLREVSRTAPYMHNGAFKTLDEVVAFYNRGGGSHTNKSPKLKRLGLSNGEMKALVAFSRASRASRWS